MVYDPKKAHDYYERTKHLKGRNKGQAGSSRASPSASSGAQAAPVKVSSETQAAIAKVNRLKDAVSKLQSALSEAEALLSKKRQDARKSAKANSDGKSTAKEKQSAKEYRDKHKTEIANKRKQDSSSSSGGGSSSTSSTSVSDMSVDQLTTRIIKIRGVLADAKRQLSNAQQQLGQLAHSDIISEPMSNVHFARFRSAERMPST